MRRFFMQSDTPLMGLCVGLRLMFVGLLISLMKLILWAGVDWFLCEISLLDGFG